MAKKRPTKSQLKNRANRKANQDAAAQQAALDAQARQAHHTYNTELGASRAAKRANQTLLQQAANRIPGNIHGLALKQIQSDIAGRMADTKGMVRYEKPQLRDDLQAQLLDVRTAQAALDADKADAAESYLSESLKKQREKAAAAREKETKFNKEVESALAEIRQQVAKARGTNPAATNAARKALRNDPRGLRNLVDYLTTSQGISVPAAEKAAKTFVYKRKSHPTVTDKAGYAAGSFADAAAAKIEANPLWWEDN